MERPRGQTLRTYQSSRAARLRPSQRSGEVAGRRTGRTTSSLTVDATPFDSQGDQPEESAPIEDDRGDGDERDDGEDGGTAERPKRQGEEGRDKVVNASASASSSRRRRNGPKCGKTTLRKDKAVSTLDSEEAEEQHYFVARSVPAPGRLARTTGTLAQATTSSSTSTKLPEELLGVSAQKQNGISADSTATGSRVKRPVRTARKAAASDVKASRRKFTKQSTTASSSSSEDDEDWLDEASKTKRKERAIARAESEVAKMQKAREKAKGNQTCDTREDDGDGDISIASQSGRGKRMNARAGGTRGKCREESASQPSSSAKTLIMPQRSAEDDTSFSKMLSFEEFEAQIKEATTGLGDGEDSRTAGDEGGGGGSVGGATRRSLSRSSRSKDDRKALKEAVVSIPREAKQCRLCPICGEKMPPASGKMRSSPLLMSQLQRWLDEYDVERTRLWSTEEKDSVGPGPSSSNRASAASTARADPARTRSATLRKLFAPSRTADLCQRHRDEVDVIPLGKRKGWPLALDVERLKEKARNGRECGMWRRLEGLIREPESSEWFNEYVRIRKEAISGNGITGIGTAGGVAGMLHSGDLEKHRAGFFGERGWEALYELLGHHFIRSPSTEDLDLKGDLVLSNINPLSSWGFIENVLIPELTCLLIRDWFDWFGNNADDGVVEDAAVRKVMEESGRYGVAMFPVDSGSHSGGGLFGDEDDSLEIAPPRGGEQGRRSTPISPGKRKHTAAYTESACGGGGRSLHDVGSARGAGPSTPVKRRTQKSVRTCSPPDKRMSIDLDNETPTLSGSPSSLPYEVEAGRRTLLGGSVNTGKRQSDAKTVVLVDTPEQQHEASHSHVDLRSPASSQPSRVLPPAPLTPSRPRPRASASAATLAPLLYDPPRNGTTSAATSTSNVGGPASMKYRDTIPSSSLEASSAGSSQLPLAVVVRDNNHDVHEIPDSQGSIAFHGDIGCATLTPPDSAKEDSNIAKPVASAKVSPTVALATRSVDDEDDFFSRRKRRSAHAL